MKVRKNILTCSLPIPMVGKLQKIVEKQIESINNKQEVRKQIPDCFFDDYKFKGVQPVKYVRSHLCYAAALICLKECYTYEEYSMNYNKFLQSLTAAVGKLLSKSETNSAINNDEHFFVSNGYVVETLFDDTFDIACRLGRAYSAFTVVMDCWRNGLIGDYWFSKIVEDFSRRLPFQNLKRDNFVSITPFQYTSLKIAIDFLEQLSEAGFECSNNFIEPVRRLKSIKIADLNLTSQCEGLTDDDFINMIKLMDDSCYNIEKHEKDDRLLDLAPYVNDLSVMALNMVKENRDFYEAAVRQVFFSTAGVTLGAMNEFEDIMFSAMSFNYEDDLIKKHNSTMAMREEAYTNLLTQNKELKSKTKKLQKEVNTLEKQIKVGDNPEIEKLTTRANALKEQLDTCNARLEEANSELSARNNKYHRMDSRIKSLESQVESLKKENARLKNSLDESNELIEDLNKDIETIQSFETPVDAFPEEDVALARTCDFVFLIPTFVSSQKLEELFPNAKFIRVSHNVSFDVGLASSKAIVCTKGLKHSAYWRIQMQCEHASIPLVPVTSYGIKTIFDVAIAEIKKEM